MADLTITPTAVVPGTNAVKDTGSAGEVITAGQVVAKSAAGLIMKCDNNAGTPEIRKPLGVALNGGAIGQPITVQTRGDITIGATVAPGVTYFSSDTPGGIGIAADNLSGEFTGVLGIGKSTTVIAIDIQYAGVAV